MFETLFAGKLAMHVTAAHSIMEGPLQGGLAPSAYPCITFSRVATTYGYTHDGPDALYPIRVQVNCWALEPQDARAIADSVRASLPLFNLTIPETSPTAVTTESPNKAVMQLASVEPDTEPPTFREILDCEIWYRDQ